MLFPDDISYGLAASALIAVIAAVLTTWVATRSIRRSLHHPRHGDEATARSRWWTALGLVLLLPAVGFLAVLGVSVAALPPGRAPLPPNSHMPMTLAATLGAVAGLALVTPTGVRWVAQRWSVVTSLPIAVRLGLRHAAVHGRSVAGLMAATLAVVFLAGMADAFTRALYLDAVGDPTTTMIQVPLNGLPASQRAELRRIAAAAPGTAVVVTATPRPASAIPVTVMVMTCPDYVRRYYVEADPATACGPGDEPLRGSFADARPGDVLRIRLADGTVHRLVVPSAELDLIQMSDILLPPDQGQWAYDASSGLVILTANAVDGSDKRLLAALHAQVPAAATSAAAKDPTALIRFHEQTAILRVGVALGGALSLAALLTTLTTARWNARRALASQYVMGVPHRTIRAATAVHYGAPLVALALVTVPVATLAAGLFLSFWGAQYVTFAATAGLTAALAGSAVVVAAAFGWLTATLGISRADLAGD